MAESVLPIQSRRAARARRLQLIQHLFAALVLANAGYSHLKVEHHRPSVLPYLEIAAALLLFGAAVRDRLKKSHDRVGWVEIAGGVMTLIEAIGKTREPHHLSFLILSFVQPAALFALGFFDQAMHAARVLRATDEFLEIRTHWLFGQRVKWTEIAGYRFDGTTLVLASGRRFKLRDIRNFDEARAWLENEFAKRELLPSQLHSGEQQADDRRGDE